MIYNKYEAEEFMNMALLEGKKALPMCSPNPPVGCVLVRDKQVISTGFTQKPGFFHAEAMAMSKIEGSAKDISVFVTLEPCSFFDRTPSCAKSLVKNKVQEVYVAILDPHPKNCGEGMRILKKAGIKVKVGTCGKEAFEDLDPYLIRPDEDKKTSIYAPMPCNNANQPKKVKFMLEIRWSRNHFRQTVALG